jgi:O-antigen ligase
MRSRAQWAAVALLLAGLVLMPLVAAKVFAWQSLLFVGWGALLLVLVSAAALLPADHAPAPPPAVTKSKRKPAAGAQAAVSDAPAEPQPRWRGPDAVDWLLVASVLVQLASIGVSVYRFGSVLYGAKVVAAAVIFWFARYGLRTPKQREGLLWALVAGGAVVAVLGLREYSRTAILLGQTEWRIFGPFYNPNCLAGYMLLTVFPAGALLFGLQTRMGARPLSPQTESPGSVRAGRRPAEQTSATASPRYHEIAALFAGVCMLLALLCTGSKAALAAFLVGAMLFGLLAASRTRWRWLVRGLTVAGAVVMVLAALALPPIRVRLVNAFGWQNHSMRFRVYTWEGAVAMIQARPWLGHGGGDFEQAFPQYAVAGYTRAAHQTYLQLAAECGVPALLIGLAWGATVLWRALRGATDLSLGLLPGLACAAGLGALTASSLQELVDYPWYVPAVAATFFALAGLVVGTVDDAKTNATASWPGARSHRPAAWAGVLLGALLLVWSLRAGYAEVIGLQADRLADERAYDAAAAAYERAARWSPGQARFAVQRAKVLEALVRPGDRDGLARAVAARLAAARLQPTEAVNYVALARLYGLARDYDSAIRAAQEATRWYPRYPRGLAQLGMVQQEAGRKTEALATFRRLADLYDTPVGQCPAVTEMVETAYAYAWIALGDAAERGKQGPEAEHLWGRAAALVSRALTMESGISAQLAAAGEGGMGRVDEDTVIAEKLRLRLGRSPGWEARFRLAGLGLALGGGEDSEVAARNLTGVAPGHRPDPAEARATAWVTLALAQHVAGRKLTEEARALAEKGLALDREAMAMPLPSGTFWLPEDDETMGDLRRWANAYLGQPTPRVPQTGD